MRIRRTLAALFVLLPLIYRPSPVAAETFSNPLRVPTGATPSSVAVGDLNADGLPDIVWGQTGISPSLVHVLLAQPNGGYVAAPTVTLPSFVNSFCRLLDTNRDAKLDLVCPYDNAFNASLVVFPGNGDGTFGSPVYTPLPTSNGNYFYAAISLPLDANGDGIPDLIVVDQINYRAYVMLGDGHSAFRLASTLNYGSAGFPIAIDLNGDGKVDLAYPSGPTVSLGNGDGTFGLPHVYSQTFDYGNICVFADMDGDGHPDAVCGYVEAPNGDIDGATHLIILHGNGDGSFNPTPIINRQFGNHDSEYDGIGTFLEPVAVMDINRDGVLDVISASNDGYGVLLGGPNLSFSAPNHYVGASIATPGSFSATFADMNGDGLQDIVATGAGGIYISYAKSNGTFAAARAFEVAQVLGNATFADFNGDGTPDIAATGDTSIQISLGNGDGTFSPYTAVTTSGVRFNFDSTFQGADAPIFAGDFNGDHKKDLLAYGASGTSSNFYVLFGNGNGTFQPPLQVPGTRSLYSPLVDTFVADVNKDGRDDIVAPGTFGGLPAGQAPDIYVSLSNGDGTFNTIATAAPIEPINTAFNANIAGIAMADFDHDGKLDAAIIEQANAYVLKGHGDGSFDSSGAVLAIPPIPGRTTQGGQNICTGDFDGDGNADIALLVNVTDPNAPELTNGTAVVVFYGKGDGTFGSSNIVGLPDHTYTQMQTADLDGDGRDDIVLRNPYQLYEAPAVGILHAIPGRAFAAEVNYVAAGGVGPVASLNQAAIVDVNRDGRPDLLFTNNLVSVSAANSIAVLLNEGTPVVTGTLIASPEPSLYGQAFTLTATFTPPAPGLLAGNISFTADGAAVGSAPLANNVAVIAVPGALAIGQHSIAAVWLGNSAYQGLGLTGTHVVLGLNTATAIASSLNPANLGQSVAFTATVTNTSSTSGSPTGSITFSDGATVLATQLLTASGAGSSTASFSTSPLAGGSHTITATYVPTGAFAASSAQITQTVNKLPSLVNLLAAPPTAPFGSPVILTASVSIGATGSVALYDGGAIFATISVNTSWQGAFTTSSLAVGTHTLTAVYSGDATYAAATSAPVVVTIEPLPQDFNIALASPSISVRAQHHTTTSLTLTSINGLADSLAISCANLPQYVTCKPTPTPAPLTASAPATVQLYLDTDSVLGYAHNTAPLPPMRRANPISLAFLLSPFGLLGAFALSRRSRRLPLRVLAILLSLLPLSLTLSGCTTIISPYDPPPFAAPGAYTIPITAVGAATHISHTANLTLTITP